MSLENSVDRIIELVSDSHEVAKAKGGTTSTPYLLANLPDAIESIPEGITPTGTKNITENGTHDVTNFASASVNVPSNDPVLQEKTVSPSTSAQAVTPDSGYDGLSKVNVNAMPTATQATPSISVDSAGEITASATQPAGYVPAGTKQATKQLTTQAEKTVTPTTSDQTAVASGRYTTGAVTVKGDANLIPANIVSGKSIFGVSGSATTGEDVTAETNAYTTELAELTTAVTALEEELAGKAAGGGGAVETCTVTVVGDTGGGYVIWSSYVDGQMLVNYPQKTNNHIYENVVCGSCFILSDVMYLDASATDGSIIAIEGMRLIYQAPETPNVNAVLTVTRD